LGADRHLLQPNQKSVYEIVNRPIKNPIKGYLDFLLSFGLASPILENTKI